MTGRGAGWPAPSRAGAPSAGSKTSFTTSIRTCCRHGTPSVIPAPAAVPTPAAVRVPAPEAPKVPAPEVTALSTELTDTFKSLTETLAGVKDVPSAEAALPRLQDFVPRLDAVKAKLEKLTEAGKDTITALVKSSQAKLKELVDKVLAIPGVGDKIKAVVDGIMAKINAFAT